MTDDDSIYFRILPELNAPKGLALLLVSYADYENFRKLGWNMERPDLSKFQKENVITFKNRADDLEEKDEIEFRAEEEI